MVSTWINRALMAIYTTQESYYPEIFRQAGTNHGTRTRRYPPHCHLANSSKASLVCEEIDQLQKRLMYYVAGRIGGIEQLGTKTWPRPQYPIAITTDGSRQSSTHTFLCRLMKTILRTVLDAISIKNPRPIIWPVPVLHLITATKLMTLIA